MREHPLPLGPKCPVHRTGVALEVHVSGPRPPFCRGRDPKLASKALQRSEVALVPVSVVYTSKEKSVHACVVDCMCANGVCV